MISFQKSLKRIFDVCCALAGCLILLLPMMFIAIMIKCTSKGPVFFRQKRIGRNGDVFVCFKFRTMIVNSGIYGTVTTATDSRITLLGKLIRRYKLDELPQLWNVLIGKMSLVGPRPDVPGYADALKGDDRKILELRPGITGPASLFFKDEECILARERDPVRYNDTVIWPKKVQLNRVYYDQWSFWKDIGYILITLFPVFDRYFHLIPQEKK